MPVSMHQTPGGHTAPPIAFNAPPTMRRVAEAARFLVGIPIQDVGNVGWVLGRPLGGL